MRSVCTDAHSNVSNRRLYLRFHAKTTLCTKEEENGMSTLLFWRNVKEWVKHFPEKNPSVEISKVNLKNLKNNGDGKCYAIIIYDTLVVYL